MHILLQGVVGSTACGLAGPDSDIDRLGVFAWLTILTALSVQPARMDAWSLIQNAKNSRGFTHFLTRERRTRIDTSVGPRRPLRLGLLAT